jgi:hypothetical protein
MTSRSVSLPGFRSTICGFLFGCLLGGPLLPAAEPPATPAPAELYGDQGGEVVESAATNGSDLVMRARRDDTFFIISNVREGIATGSKTRPALFIDYKVARRGKFDGGVLAFRTPDGKVQEVAMNSITGRDEGTMELHNLQTRGPAKSKAKSLPFPKEAEAYLVRGDDRYRPAPRFLISNVVVLGSAKVATKPRDWTQDEIAMYGNPPPNYLNPNAHPDFGEDVPKLTGQGRRYVEPNGHLLGLEFHLGRWDNQDCVGGLTPIFALDQPATKDARSTARKGYAVAGAEVHADKFVNAIRLLFCRVKSDGTLNMADRYKGEWIGRQPPPGAILQTLVNDGRRVAGIHIQTGAIVDRFSLVVE